MLVDNTDERGHGPENSRAMGAVRRRRVSLDVSVAGREFGYRTRPNDASNHETTDASGILDAARLVIDSRLSAVSWATALIEKRGSTGGL